MELLLNSLLILVPMPSLAQRPRQTYDFQANGFDRITVASATDTGFCRTPGFKCTATNVPGIRRRLRAATTRLW